MNQNPVLMLAMACLLFFLCVTMGVRFGWPIFLRWLQRTERWYDKVLNQHLILDIPPRSAMWLSMMGILICALIAY